MSSKRSSTQIQRTVSVARNTNTSDPNESFKIGPKKKEETFKTERKYGTIPQVYKP